MDMAFERLIGKEIYRYKAGMGIGREGFSTASQARRVLFVIYPKYFLLVLRTRNSRWFLTRETAS
jgi:hypothetical protein